MAVESASDRLNFFDDDDFGVSAKVGAKVLYGILENEYYAVDVGGFDVESNQPRFTCRTADLPTITLGTTTCTISTTAYVIVSNEPDGTGISVLRLREPS